MRPSLFDVCRMLPRWPTPPEEMEKHGKKTDALSTADDRGRGVGGMLGGFGSGALGEGGGYLSWQERQDSLREHPPWQNGWRGYLHHEPQRHGGATPHQFLGERL